MGRGFQTNNKGAQTRGGMKNRKIAELKAKISAHLKANPFGQFPSVKVSRQLGIPASKIFEVRREMRQKLGLPRHYEKERKILEDVFRRAKPGERIEAFSLLYIIWKMTKTVRSPGFIKSTVNNYCALSHKPIKIGWRNVSKMKGSDPVKYFIDFENWMAQGASNGKIRNSMIKAKFTLYAKNIIASIKLLEGVNTPEARKSLAVLKRKLEVYESRVGKVSKNS